MFCNQSVSTSHLNFVEQLSILESLGPDLLLQVVLPDLVHLEHLQVGDSGRQDPALVVLDIFCQLVEPCQDKLDSLRRFDQNLKSQLNHM